MTAIVGLIDSGKNIWMAGDSAGVNQYSLTIRTDPKVFKNQHCYIGFTTSFRMGQLLNWKFKPPEHDPNISVEEYINTIFIDEIRKCLRLNDWSQTISGRESGGSFLVGYRSQLFRIESDFQVETTANDFLTCGCADDVLNGSLYSTRHLLLHPMYRIETALEAAEQFNAGVRRPFIILSESSLTIRK